MKPKYFNRRRSIAAADHGAGWLRAGLLGVLVAFGLIGSRLASAGETDPVLLVTRAIAVDGIGGTSVRVDATFPWNALLQSGFPLGLVVWHTDGSNAFVRFPLEGSPTSGTSALLIDGLEPGELAAFLAEGESDASHALSLIGEGSLEVRLAPGSAGAPLAVQLFVVDTGTPFVSNPLPAVRSLP